LGPGIESEEVLKTLGPILKKIICDGTASIQARQTCATCFGVCCFIATDDITELYSTLECLESIFTKSYLKEKDTNVICSTPNTVLHISSLLAWTLLLTICPINEVKKKLEMYVLLASYFIKTTFIDIIDCVHTVMTVFYAFP